jgi:Fe-S-cluster-containing dehydrogenase component
MKCTWCGERIEDEPVWKKNKPYCSEECVEMELSEEEEKKEEEEEEEEEEE